MMAAKGLTGAILAGGRSSRMGGGVKALLPLAGKPMIRHVIDRIEPQVGELWISVERLSAELSVFALPQVPDPRPGSRGPLGGLYACVQRLPDEASWLFLAPCDAPFLPRNLAARLLQHAGEAEQPGCVVGYRGEVQPTFSVWHASLLPKLEESVLEERLGGFKAFLQRHPLPVLDWPETDVSPFTNINDHNALEEAEGLLVDGEEDHVAG